MKNNNFLCQLGLILFALALTWTPLSAEVPAVLKYMPADSAAIIATQPLTTLNTKANAFAKKLGLPIPPDQPLDLGMLLSAQLGIPGQIDASKGIGISIGNLMQVEQTLVVFLPTTNANKALIALGAVKSEEAPEVWSLPNQKGFAKQNGNYLMIAPKAITLTAMAGNPKGVKLSGSDKTLFSRSDIAVTANLAPIMGMAKMMIPAMLMNNPQVQQHPALMQIVNLVMERLAELEKGSIGLSLADSGINLGLHFHAQAGSQLASYLSDHPTTDISELAVLPPGSFSTIYAFNYNGEAFRPCLDGLFNVLETDPALSEKIRAENIAELKALLTYKMDAKGAMAEYATSPTASGGKKMLGITSGSDLDKMLAASQNICSLITKMMAQFGFDLPITYKAKAGTAAGLSYDEVSMDMSKVYTDPQMVEALKTQWGESLSFTEKICKLDDKRAAVAIGDGSLEELIKFINSGQPGLDKDPAILNTAKNLPDKANIYAFFHVGNAVRSMLATAPPQMMMMAGMLTQIQGVVGVSANLEQGSLKTEIHIPNDVIESIGMMVQQFMMMMQPAPQPGSAQPPL